MCVCSVSALAAGGPQTSPTSRPGEDLVACPTRSIMNSFINDIFEKIATESAKLSRYSEPPPAQAPSTPLYFLFP